MTFAWGLLGLPVMSPFQLYGLLPGLPTFSAEQIGYSAPLPGTRPLVT